MLLQPIQNSLKYSDLNHENREQLFLLRSYVSNQLSTDDKTH